MPGRPELLWVDGKRQCGVRNLPNHKQAAEWVHGFCVGSEILWEKDLDSVSSLPGMSFNVQKMQQRLKTSVTKAENAFVPILLYPADVRK